MSQIKIELELPESLYSELQDIADSSDWPLNKVLVQTIRAGMPPALNKVPQEFHAELLVLNQMSDQELLKLAEAPWDEAPDRSDKHKKADFVALQRTYIWSLLKWRGHPVPTPFEF